MADKKEMCRKPVEKELEWDNSPGVAAASETAKPLMRSEGFVTGTDRAGMEDDGGEAGDSHDKSMKNVDETARVRPKQQNRPR